MVFQDLAKLALVAFVAVAVRVDDAHDSVPDAQVVQQPSSSSRSGGAIEPMQQFKEVQNLKAQLDATEQQVAQQAAPHVAQEAAPQVAQEAPPQVALKTAAKDGGLNQAKGADDKKTELENAQRLKYKLKQAKQAREEADRIAAEKAVLSKAAQNKMKEAMNLAAKTIEAKKEQRKIEATKKKVAADAENVVVDLTKPLAKARQEDAAQAAEAQQATELEDEAVANDAVARRVAHVKKEEAENLKAVADDVKVQAAKAKDEHETAVAVKVQKAVEKEEAIARKKNVVERSTAVMEEKAIADKQMEEAAAMAEAARQKAAQSHKVAVKAAKDHLATEDEAATQYTIAQAAKEESHRATSKAFKALYRKVNSEKNVMDNVNKETAALSTQEDLEADQK